jgi:hypothetical protein
MSSHLISKDQDRLRPPMVCLQMLGRRFPDIWPRLDVLRAEFVSVPNEYPPNWYRPFHAVRSKEARSNREYLWVVVTHFRFLVRT